MASSYSQRKARWEALNGYVSPGQAVGRPNRSKGEQSLKEMGLDLRTRQGQMQYQMLRRATELTGIFGQEESEPEPYSYPYAPSDPYTREYEDSGEAKTSSLAEPPQECESTRVTSFQWLANAPGSNSGELYVRFKNERPHNSITLYKYSGVKADYERMVSAPRKGVHVNTHLNKLPYSRVESPPPDIEI